MAPRAGRAPGRRASGRRRASRGARRIPSRARPAPETDRHRRLPRRRPPAAIPVEGGPAPRHARRPPVRVGIDSPPPPRASRPPRSGSRNATGCRRSGSRRRSTNRRRRQRARRAGDRRRARARARREQRLRQLWREARRCFEIAQVAHRHRNAARETESKLAAVAARAPRRRGPARRQAARSRRGGCPSAFATSEVPNQPSPRSSAGRDAAHGPYRGAGGHSRARARATYAAVSAALRSPSSASAGRRSAGAGQQLDTLKARLADTKTELESLRRHAGAHRATGAASCSLRSAPPSASARLRATRSPRPRMHSRPACRRCARLRET